MLGEKLKRRSTKRGHALARNWDMRRIPYEGPNSNLTGNFGRNLCFLQNSRIPNYQKKIRIPLDFVNTWYPKTISRITPLGIRTHEIGPWKFKIFGALIPFAASFLPPHFCHCLMKDSSRLQRFWRSQQYHTIIGVPYHTTVQHTNSRLRGKLTDHWYHRYHRTAHQFKALGQTYGPLVPPTAHQFKASGQTYGPLVLPIPPIPP